jgi:tRNA-specific 2-thiouridylase
LRHCAGGVEVELIAGEDGVSPGQACVFYDAQTGQARVLGGGIIQSAAAAGEVVPAREAKAGRAAAPG